MQKRKNIKSNGLDYTINRLNEINAGASMYNPGSITEMPLLDWAVEDGSFLRVNNISIGYTLPKRLTSHLGMSNLRIYASGLNLFAWNRFKLWDVEQGNDGMQYPIQAVYNFGINLSF